MKKDAGTLNLGKIEHGGEIYINQGTVNLLDIDDTAKARFTVDTAGTLSGHRQISGNVFNSEGIVVPGSANTPGTLTIGGDYSQHNGTLRINITPTEASLLDVTGAIKVEGETALEIIATPSSDYKVGQSFTILKSLEGIEGTFSKTTLTGGQFTSGSGYSFELQQEDGTEGSILKLVLKYLAPTETPAPQTTEIEAGQDLKAEILASTETTIIHYQAIGNIVGGNASDTSQDQNCSTFAEYAPQARYEMKMLGQLHQQSTYASALQQLNAYKPTSKHHIQDKISKKSISTSPFTMIQETGKILWVRAMGALGFQNNDGPVTGYKSRSGGLVAGLNTNLFKDMPFGIFAGYTGTRIDMKSDRGKADVGRVFAGPYLTIPFGKNFALNTMLSLGFGKTDNERNVLGAPVKTTAKSKQKNVEIFGSATLTYTAIKNDWILTPYIGVEALDNRRKAYTERGAGQFNMSVGRQSTLNIAGTTGYSLAKVYAFEEGRWSAQITTGYRYDRKFKGKTTFSLSGNPLSLSADLPRKTRHSFNIGPSVAVVYKSGWTVHGGYQATLAKKSHAHEFMVGLKKKI